MNGMNDKVRVRFAPSPTGGLHIGGVRTALFNYLFAKKNNGTLILRIEDTDQTRFVEGAEEYIIKSLDWLGIEFQEGPHIGGDHEPYRQSERSAIYQKYAKQLIDSGHAYYAFDTSEELDEMRENLKKAGAKSAQYNFVTRNSMKNSLTLPEDEVKRRLESGEPYVVRMKVPRKKEIRFHDEVRSWVVIHSSQIDDKVLLKSDGLPTYHLANIVDDHLMEITHVIRGEEWLPSTPLHVLLYEAFAWEMPKFAHLPLILRPDSKGKMSKRDADKLGVPIFPLTWEDKSKGEISVGYKEAGYLPEAMINFLVLLGWHPSSNQEVFSMKELEEIFTLDRIGKSGTKFDLHKLNWYNQHYLRESSIDVILPELKKLLQEVSIELPGDEYLVEVINLMKERMYFVKDIVDEGKYFFETPTEYNEKMLKKQWNLANVDVLKQLVEAMEQMDEFSVESIDGFLNNFAEERGLKKGKLMPLMRLAATGTNKGPNVGDILAVLGKDHVVERMNNLLKIEVVE